MPDLPPITILMAVYNGGTHLAEQLDSIAAQHHRDWRLIISDDGSRDDSVAISAAFRDRVGAERVTLIDGPGQGPTRNFLHLIQHAPKDSLLAFSDQDDVWLPEKLSRAAAALAQTVVPTLYCARTLICDDQLQNRVESRLFGRPHGFRNALVQACTPGNTSAFNLAASALLKRGAAAARDVEAHDWWAYQLVSGAGGAVIFDPEPMLLYRQHAANVMGRNDTPRGRLRRMTMLMGGDYGRWLAANADALAAVAHLLSPENRALLSQFAAMLRLPGPMALLRLRQMGLYRQTTDGDLALNMAAGLGRLRQSNLAPAPGSDQSG